MRSPSATSPIGPPSTASGRDVPDAQAVRRAREPAVGDQRHVAAVPDALDGRGDGQHLAHPRPALGALVADDDHVAGHQLAAEHVLHRGLLAVEHAGRALEALRVQTRHLDDGAGRRERSRAARPARRRRGSGRRSGGRRRRPAPPGASSARFSATVLPVTVRQSPSSTPASSSIRITTGMPPTASMSLIRNRPWGRESTRCGTRRPDAVEVVERQLDPRLVRRSPAGAAPRWSNRRPP